jgi:hypothetical protein
MSEAMKQAIAALSNPADNAKLAKLLLPFFPGIKESVIEQTLKIHNPAWKFQVTNAMIKGSDTIYKAVFQNQSRPLKLQDYLAAPSASLLTGS